MDKMKSIMNCVIKQLHNINIIAMLRVFLEHTWNICIVYCKAILHFPLDVLYVNSLVFVIVVLSGYTYSSIFEILKKVNTVYMYTLLFSLSLLNATFVYICKSEECRNENEALCPEKPVPQNPPRKVRATLYENGTIRTIEIVNILEKFKNKPLEELPFNVNNVYPNKTYKLELEEIKSEVTVNKTIAIKNYEI